MIVGVHFVPLRKLGGDPASHTGIFIEIQLNQEQASDELEIPISPLSDTHTTNITNSESTHLDNRVDYKPQVTVTADVHFDNISSNC